MPLISWVPQAPYRTRPTPVEPVEPVESGGGLAKANPWRRLAELGLATVLGLAAALPAAWAGPAEIERGRRLFNGELPLPGRVTGHTADLPPQASRCSNCHGAGTAPPAQGVASAPTASFGPTLNADALTRDLARRGGPPSRYNEAALCKLLSTGIDPAYIIIPRSMPRYDVVPADCAALWAYLSQRRP